MIKMLKSIGLKGKTMMMVALFLCYFVPTQAQIADSPCDYEGYWKSLKARAWMEAQREISQNQTLIHKADSVLQYSCFDKFAQELAQNADKLFSESTRWGNVDLGNYPQNTHMDNALQNAVGNSLIYYLGLNFNHKLLGGRYDGQDSQSVQGGKYKHQTITSGGGYTNCDVMQAVWTRAQCYDFNKDPEHDGFFTFADFAKEDKRFPKGSCEASNAGDQPLTQLWTDMIAAAYPEPEDPLKTYQDMLGPEDCAGSKPIVTGIVVKRPQDKPTEFNEKICIKPGCNYVPTGKNSGECQPN